MTFGFHVLNEVGIDACLKLHLEGHGIIYVFLNLGSALLSLNNHDVFCFVLLKTLTITKKYLPPIIFSLGKALTTNVMIMLGNVWHFCETSAAFVFKVGHSLRNFLSIEFERRFSLTRIAKDVNISPGATCNLISSRHIVNIEDQAFAFSKHAGCARVFVTCGCPKP